MKYSDQSYNLRIELDAKHCELTPAEIEKLQSSLSPLRKVVECFPVSDLYITVFHHPRSGAFQVKTSLVLPGQTLFSREEDEHVHPAFERSVTNLVQQVEAYKDSLGSVDERAKFQKGTYQEIVPTQEPDAETLEEAVRERDYAAFRFAASAYEEPVRKRVGRWVARYPELDARIGTELALYDLVEAVFLTAFDSYRDRPNSLRLGEWLEGLIDVACKRVRHHPDEEMERISFAHTLQEMAMEGAGAPAAIEGNAGPSTRRDT